MLKKLFWKSEYYITKKLNNLDFDGELSWCASTGLLKDINRYLSYNSPTLKKHNHISTVSGNDVIAELETYRLAPNIMHQVLRRHAANINSCIAYNKLSNETVDALRNFKDENKAYVKIVNSVKDMYFVNE